MMDGQFDYCSDCGNTDFALHFNEWERTCTNCGLVSCIEFSLDEPPMEKKYYMKKTYFRNTIIPKAIQGGAPINNEEIETLLSMFERSVTLFHQNKQYMKRRNYPSSQFVLYKLGLLMNKDFKKWCKLPKLAATLKQVECDWKYINPAGY